MRRTSKRTCLGATLAGVVVAACIAGEVGAQATTAHVLAERAVGMGSAKCSDIQDFAGRRIAWIDVITLAPDPLPGPAAILDRFHTKTRPAVLRRELLVHAGELLRPDRLAESLRRFGALPYLARVELTLSPASIRGTPPQMILRGGEGCAVRAIATAGMTDIGLTLVTRDAWTTRPSVRLGGARSGSMIGLQERDLMGAGRVGRLYLRSDLGRTGVGLAYVDPWFLGHDVVAGVSRESYRGGGAWRLFGRTHERSVFDAMITEFDGSRTKRASTVGGFASGDTVQIDAMQLLLERRVAASAAGATRLLFGIEGERTRERIREGSGAADAVVGPLHVSRTFVGADLGVVRRTARYATNDWLLPRQRVGRDSSASNASDIPVGGEGELVVGVGHEFVAGVPAQHVDAWAGWTWPQLPHWLLAADAWGSGYRAGGEWSAASLRGRVAAYHEAHRGLWSGMLSAEELTDPDPTVRTLTTVDPTLPVLPPRNRLAEAAVAGVLSRTVHLRPVSHGYMLDAALFSAGSLRWDPAGAGADRIGVVTIGAGLHLTPFRQHLATIQLDLSLPVVRTPGIASRPFVSLSIAPWLGSGRQRNGGVQR